MNVLPATQPVASVEFQLTEGDLLTYQHFRLWNEAAGRKRLLRDWLLAVLGYAVFAVVLHLAAGGIQWYLLALTIVILSALHPLLAWRGRVLSVRRRLADQPDLEAPRTVTLSAEGCYGRAEGVEIRRSWHSIREIVSTVEHLYFIQDDIHAIVIPRRAFSSPAAAERFAAIARDLRQAAREAPEPETPPETLKAALGPEQLPVEYELTEQDYVRFNWYSLRRDRRLLLQMGGTSAAIGFVAGNLGGIGLGVAAAVGYLAYLLLTWPGKTRRALRELPGLLGRQRLVLSPVALWGWAPDLGEAVEEWNTITEVTATADAILLLRGKESPVIIPKRAFTGAEEADHFLLRACEWRAAHVANRPPEEKHGRR